MDYLVEQYESYLRSIEKGSECLECGTEILSEGFCSKDCSDAYLY